MTVRIVDAGDRLHVLTPGYEWTILRAFADGRGPCYISDVRERAGQFRQVIRDGGLGHTINDEHFGGLFGFGVVAAMPPPSPEPATFWDWGWEITTRLDGAGGWGVAGQTVISRVAGGVAYVSARCHLVVHGNRVAELSWDYVFGPGDEVTVELDVEPIPLPGLWIKEPKLVANGLRGYRHLAVAAADGSPLAGYDLTTLHDPRRHTQQVAEARRYRYDLTGLRRPPLSLTYDLGLDVWTRDADRDAPMSTRCTPAYCLNDGKLWDRTEVTRDSLADLCGLLWHGWEGGTGADDCWSCFRPWPTEDVLLNASARLG